MITLGTGLPGNGKTLFMLSTIAAKAKKENREVYYHNIKLADVEPVNSWQKFEPEKWMDLPHGSIVVIDECQEVFPKKPNGAQLPPHYEELAKHRHKGFDMFFITQHPTLIDNFVRRLVGQHYHSVRKFGMQRATVYEWSACNPAPENVASQKSAITLKWAYPKEVYGWYKSAEVHTVKRSIPMKLVLAVLFVVAVLAAGVWALDRYQHRYDKQKPAVAAGETAGVALVASPAGQFSPKTPAEIELAAKMRELEDLREYVRQQTARVAGLPQTAPKYDELTKPVRVPVPAMCIQIGTVSGSKDVTCKCWSQQATRMPDVPFNMCIEFARNGFFRDFDADRDRLASERTERGVDAIRAVPEASIPVREDRSRPVRVMLPGKAMGPQRTDTSPGLNEAGEVEDGPPNNRATRAAAGAKVAGL
ncbi:zonular occludens toxin domain-containing protein [Massilia sp. CT11-108]|uniref:zonular occludens toxin domain-containing protein n=1 Tax=Massilia sp. CT11-108 TaxID=3393900 RepID=UPI0039A45679